MENINHPNHYNREGRKECIVEMRERYGRLIVLGFDRGNNFKYNYRMGEKEGEPMDKDGLKAMWYDDHAKKVWDSFNWFQKLVARIALKICR